MYLKLVFNGNSGTNGTSHWQPVFATIANFVTGVWTSTSQITSTLITKESSVISGTAPTVGIYTASAGDYASDNANYNIKKFHYAKGLNNNAFQASSQINLTWNAYNGFKVRYYDALVGNGYPATGAMSYLTSNNSTAASRWNDANNAADLININGLSVIHCIITDHVFVIQVQTTGNAEQKDYGTWMLADLEYLPNIDNYAYNSNARYTPQTYVYWIWLDSMDAYSGVRTGTTRTATGIYRPQYLDQYGTFRNTPLGQDYNLTTHYGNQTANSTAPVLHPRPMNRVYQIPVTSGDYAHQLVPLMYNGQSDSLDNFGDPRHSRLMSCYRTSEDLGFTGDIITEGSGNFRIFRIHKCGNHAPSLATLNACYAFPEFNIPYGS